MATKDQKPTLHTGFRFTHVGARTALGLIGRRLDPSVAAGPEAVVR